MEIVVEAISNVTRIAPKGKIDSSTAAVLGAQVKEIIESGRIRLVIDMGDVAYVSSAGVRSLLIATEEAKCSGGRLALYGLAPEVHRLFEIGGFAEVFTIGSSLDDCIARMSRTR